MARQLRIEYEVGLAKRRTCSATQERPGEGRAGARRARANYDELEMDSPALGNGIMDAPIQPSCRTGMSPMSKVRTDPFFSFCKCLSGSIARAQRRTTPYIFPLTECKNSWQACTRAKSVRRLPKELHLALFPQSNTVGERLVHTDKKDKYLTWKILFKTLMGSLSMPTI